MGPFRARVFAALLGAVVVVLLAIPAGAQPQSDRSVVILAVLPTAEARLFLSSHPAGIGLGVFPEHLDALRFIAELGWGAPRGPRISTGDTKSLRLADVLYEAGTAISVGGALPEPIVELLLSVFPPGGHRGPGELRDFQPRFFERSSQLEQLLRDYPPADLVVIGVEARTPVLVGLCDRRCVAAEGSSAVGVLDGGIARRPAIVTPYDIEVTIMRFLGVPKPREGFIGRALNIEPVDDAFGYVDRIERRLVRDASAGSTAAVITDAIAVMMLMLGIVFVRIRMAGVGAPGAQGGWMAIAVGYPVSRFLASGSGTVRAIPVVAAFVLGAMLSPQRTRRNARIFFGIAIATALMFALAPLNPGGEPGLSIWGNPLTSWRFFGMQNAWAATIAAGVVIWGALAGIATRALVAVAAAVAIVMGAPTIGANFVGVLTFTFGAALATLALARRKLELVHVLIAGATAVVAFLLALLADVGSPVSHGGRAAKRISDGGISTAWDFVTGRIRLNVDLIRDFWGGVVWVVLFIVALMLLARWGARVTEGPLRARAAVWAGSMMALASLVLEDSGFFSGTTLLGAALAAWIVNAATVDRARLDPASAPGDG